MDQVDDRIQPRAQKIALARLAPFPWTHPPRSAQITSEPENHKSNLQGISFSSRRFRKNRLLRSAASRFKIKHLGILHRRQIKVNRLRRAKAIRGTGRPLVKRRDSTVG